jgi:hypothetical protein
VLADDLAVWGYEHRHDQKWGGGDVVDDRDADGQFDRVDAELAGLRRYEASLVRSGDAKATARVSTVGVGVRRAIASVCLLVGLVMCLAGCGLDRRQQALVSVEQLTSIAAEGALMADDLARNRTTTTFVRVHGDELSAQAQHEAEKLNDDSIPNDLKARAQDAIKLASEIGGAIDELRTSPQDRGQDRRDWAKLRQWSAEAYRLGNSI